MITRRLQLAFTRSAIDSLSPLIGKTMRFKSENISPSTMGSAASHPEWSTRRWLVGLALSVFALVLLNAQSEFYTICSKSRNIYTVDSENPRVECISVRGSRIFEVGDYASLVGKLDIFLNFADRLPGWVTKNIWIGPRVIQIDEKSILVPGLADAHAHVIENGFMMQLPLVGAKSVQEVIDRVKAYILSHPDVMDDMTRWIEGMGWDQTTWPGGDFPTAVRDPG
ncbi:hypothetical protein GALMADRAFT_1317785 [Galerina marginata CBS 339.88]|uniref:Amidohydrolase 3 domain-containing protein n=1 Tax=Galerina marginata (strain CBS 339.88) TaxID=685588 RepID=A0A067THC4_GALM3|nr:hypothetical protein GALMADRAFT_1317785 [Galerina marginata CBS 339.88]